MNVFLDSSVLLRLLFGEPRSLKEWSRIKQAYASRLLELEVARVIDRARLLGQIGDDDVAMLQQEFRRILPSISVLAINDKVLGRAACPMPTVLGTLDAIHLATALELVSEVGDDFVVATHDQQLATASRASGLKVVGV